MIFLLVPFLSFAEPPAGRLAQECQNAVDKLAAAGKGPTCRLKQMAAVAPPALPAKTVQVPGSNGKPVDVSVVPEEQLKSLFYFVTTLGLPWKSSRLCSQRAQIMGQELFEQKGILSGKLMTKPKRAAMGLFSGSITPQYEDGRRPQWDYHVAPFVAVERDGRIEQWVIDPSTFTRPVRREEWEKFQENRGETFVTNRFALDLRDTDSDLNSYTGHRAIGHTWQVIDENRGKP